MLFYVSTHVLPNDELMRGWGVLFTEEWALGLEEFRAGSSSYKEEQVGELAGRQTDRQTDGAQ